MCQVRFLLGLPLLAWSGVALPNPPGYLWVPNGAEGTVSKLDAATGEEVARYASITRDPDRVVSHVVASLPAWGAAHKTAEMLHSRGEAVTVSIGGAALRSDESWQSWLARADAALYQAKHEGRNRSVVSGGPEAIEAQAEPGSGA